MTDSCQKHETNIIEVNFSRLSDDHDQIIQKYSKTLQHKRQLNMETVRNEFAILPRRAPYWNRNIRGPTG